MASKMCQLKQTIASILQGVQYISFALQNIRDRTPDPTTKAALRGPVRGICHVEEKWEKAAHTQGKSIAEFENWATRKPEFNCIQLQRFAQKQKVHETLCAPCPIRIALAERKELAVKTTRPSLGEASLAFLRRWEMALPK